MQERRRETGGVFVCTSACTKGGTQERRPQANVFQVNVRRGRNLPQRICEMPGKEVSMKTMRMFGGVAATLAALTVAAPAFAQGYTYGDRYDNRYSDRYETQDRLAGRDARLMDSVQQLISEVQGRRNDIRVSFFNSEMRNLQRMEDTIRQARYMGGLSDGQYRSNRNLLDRLESRFNDELRTARNYDYYDGRYANRW
jgi:hypothetical protein